MASCGMRRLLLLPALLFSFACEEPAPTPVEAPDSSPPPPGSPTGGQVGTRPEVKTDGTDKKTASGDVIKSFKLPGGEVLVPPAWQPKMRKDTPMTSLHVMPMPGMTCDLAVLTGHGTKEQAEQYLTAGAAAYKGEEERAPDVVIGGKPFQGILIKKPQTFPDNADALVEVYATLSGDNLIGVGVTRLEQSEKHAEARKACMGAFAKYAEPLPAPSAVPPPTVPSEAAPGARH